MNAHLVLYFRSKEVDWEKFFTKKLVDDFASHLRLFRTAQEKIRKWEQKEGMYDPSTSNKIQKCLYEKKKNQKQIS